MRVKVQTQLLGSTRPMQAGIEDNAPRDKTRDFDHKVLRPEVLGDINGSA